jgi:hypothetical protein
MDSDQRKTDALALESEGERIDGSEQSKPKSQSCRDGGCCGDDCSCANHEHSHDGVNSDDDDDDLDDESFLGGEAPTVDCAAPEVIDDLAAACVRFVHDTIKVELDFTPETLPLLDHYLGVAREIVAEKLELRELIFRAAGAYFGEVLRRRLNGYWLMPTEDVHSWRVCGRHVFLAVNPVGVIAEAIAESEDSGGPSGALRLARADRDDVAQRLAEVPSLPENEFFLTSTRLEVIDIVVDHLRMRMDQHHQSDIEFDREDYSTDLMTLGTA